MTGAGQADRASDGSRGVLRTPANWNAMIDGASR
jgi:hypothetical protein